MDGRVRDGALLTAATRFLGADLHRLATRMVLRALVEAGVLVGSVEEVSAAGLGKIFLPCGMGHLIGNGGEGGGHRGATHSSLRLSLILYSRPRHTRRRGVSARSA